MLVAGGIGIAPLCFLAEQLQKKQISITLLMGVRNQESLCLLDDIRKTQAEIKVATEDGSAGMRGLVTEFLADAIHESKPEIIYSCGPVPMLKHVVSLAQDLGVKTQVSLEERMACGVGACRGCVALIRRNGKSGYENVCTSGPVFWGSEVVFDD
jgi:dihydroorotate dehydrogenase electron transfer subunit